MMPPTYKIAGGRKDKPLISILEDLFFPFILFFLDQKGIIKEGRKKKKGEKKRRETYSTREGKNALTGARK